MRKPCGVFSGTWTKVPGRSGETASVHVEFTVRRKTGRTAGRTEVEQTYGHEEATGRTSGDSAPAWAEALVM